MSVRARVAHALAWANVYLFALLLGAHVFDTRVLVPLWTVAPPESLQAWLVQPMYPDVPSFMVPLLILLLFIPVAALAAGFHQTASRSWLILMTVCAAAHLALVSVFFIPTNEALGFFADDPTSVVMDGARAQALVEQWRAWNVVRIVIDASGLFAAVKATGLQARGAAV